MSTDNHTPIQTGSPANASTFNDPMGQLDSAIGALSLLTTTDKLNLVGAINELDSAKQDNDVSQSANLIKASPNGAAGVPGYRSLAIPDLPNTGVTPGIKTKITVNEKGLVTAGDSQISTADISDLSSTPLTSLGLAADLATHNSSEARPGLLRKLSGIAEEILNGAGAWVKWAMGVKYNSSGSYTPRKYINFTGAGVSVSDDPTKDEIKVTISGIAGGTQALETLSDVDMTTPLNNQVVAYDQAAAKWKNLNIASFIPTGHTVQDEGINLTGRPSLNFKGGGISAADNGTTNSTDITVPAASETKLDALSTPDDTTNLDVSILAHGLIPKLPNDGMRFFAGDGTYKKVDSALLGGWLRLSDTGTFVNSLSFTLPGDLTTMLGTGVKVKLTNSGVKFGYIHSVSKSGGVTTINLVSNTSYVLDSDTVTNIDISYGVPPDFPKVLNYGAAISASAGAITTVTISKACFLMIGGLVATFLDFIVTNNGTGAGILFVTSPIAPGSYLGGIGSFKNIATGKMGSVSPSISGTMNCLLYDGTYPVATGNRVIMSCVYSV